MNIRSAVSAATTHLVLENSQWTAEYVAAINALSARAKDGVQSWEFGTHANKPRKRTEAEVLQLFTDTIEGLDTRAQKSVRAGAGAKSV